ncbi:hypothetical protein BDY24DRAFT_401538 [Mrakia frigida]|uniref:uncharacterized protein n=1 Tax=Mrakia frigida TaxID=29902 RepID=UPI003FCC1064
MPSMWKEGILLVVVVVVVVEGEGEGGVVQVMSPSKNMNPGQPGEGKEWKEGVGRVDRLRLKQRNQHSFDLYEGGWSRD